MPIASCCIPRRTIALLALLIITTGCRFQAASSATADDRPAQASEDSTWQPVIVDIHDQEHSPFAGAPCPALVVIFVMHDCPISNSYIPQLNRRHDWLDDQKISLLLVHADPNITIEQARQHADEYKITWPVVLDPEQAWAKRAGATRVPEAVVFSRTEEVLYRGRIDNRYAAPGKRRAVTTSHDLRVALEAIVSGKPVAHPRTEAVGCFINIANANSIANSKESAGADEHANP